MTMSAKTIVLTRPIGQTQALMQALRALLSHHDMFAAEQPNILSVPLLSIIPKDGEALTEQVRTALQRADLAIFVSPNAIECTLRLVGKSWQALSPQPLTIGVMGGSSQQTLHKYGIGLEDAPTPILIPDQPGQWDSEGLWKKLQDSHQDWAHRKVSIFKGEGGRDWLADTLQQAGALVEPISVYSRAPLDSANPIWLTIQTLDFAQSLWLLTSSEAVRYLGKVMQAQFSGRLRAASAICTHHNIAGAAEQIGFGKVLLCEPGDAAVTEAAMAWLSSSED